MKVFTETGLLRRHLAARGDGGCQSEDVSKWTSGVLDASGFWIGPGGQGWAGPRRYAAGLALANDSRWKNLSNVGGRWRNLRGGQ